MAAPAWLAARPIAHRGLHDRVAGRPENTTAAAEAAIAGGFAVECDVQRSADGEAVVFHDFTLDRLTSGTGPVAAQPARMLGALAVGGSDERIPTLPAFLDMIAGRVPLVCEIKSGFDGDLRLADRVRAVLAAYPGPVAIKSFDPAVIAHLRKAGTGMIPLGIVAEARYAEPEWDEVLSPDRKREFAALMHFPDTDPDFLSFHVEDLPHAAPALFRAALRRPVMTWTVRRPDQVARSRRWADAMVFEGFMPDAMPQRSALV